MENKMSEQIKLMCKTAMMAAMVFLGTYFFKIPSPNGYTHLGDCMIFTAVLVLGGKRGALAGGIGAALADLLGGYIFWVVPTFFIKAIMALVMCGFCKTGIGKLRFGWTAGAVLGGIFQIAAYTVVKIPVFGLEYAITRLPGLIVQTICGVVIAAVIVTVFNESGIIRKLREV